MTFPDDKVGPHSETKPAGTELSWTRTSREQARWSYLINVGGGKRQMNERLYLLKQWSILEMIHGRATKKRYDLARATSLW